MLNYLKDCTKQTLIGLLPDIINHNNRSIESEFNYIFDTSLNRLTKSVYAPSGSVKAHFGEFVNLSAEYLTVKNVDSLKDTIKSATAELFVEFAEDHNMLNNRFADDSTGIQNYCHDAKAIAYDKSTNVYIKLYDIDLQQVTMSGSIEDLNNNVDDLKLKILEYDSSINKCIADINTHNNLIKDNQVEIKNLNINLNKVLQDLSKTDSIALDAYNIANNAVNKNNKQDVSINNNKLSIDSIANSTFLITYQGVTYSVGDLMQLIVWKAGLETKTITYKDASNNNLTITILCQTSSIQQNVQLANTGLNNLTGETSSISNPSTYTQLDLDDAEARIDTLIG